MNQILKNLKIRNLVKFLKLKLVKIYSKILNKRKLKINKIFKK